MGTQQEKLIADRWTRTVEKNAQCRFVSSSMLFHSEFGRLFGANPHCVRTATLVEPRVTSPPSLNRTKIRFAAGSKGTLPLPWTKIPKVGVALALICVVTLAPIAEMQCPWPGWSDTERYSPAMLRSPCPPKP